MIFGAQAMQKRVLIIFATVFACEQSGTVLAGEAVSLDAITKQRIGGVFQDFNKPDSPGYAIGISHDGEVLFKAGYGSSNLEDGVPITGRTVFHLASLSKQFTASAIAVLLDERRISLDDPVDKYIPEAVRYGAGLQVKHLIYMTSGLVEYSAVPRKSGAPWYSAYYFDIDEAIATSLSQPLAFRPGAQWAYRNVNYMLLAKIVEKVTGQSLNAYLNAQFFTPLQMTSTLVDDDPTWVIPHRAIGYAPRNAAIVQEGDKVGMHWRAGRGWVRLDRVSPHYGGSGIFSSVDDLAKWNANLDDGMAGGAAYTDRMRSRMRFSHSKDNDAFGLVWRTYRGRPMLDYAGEDLDANSYMANFTESHIAVICLSNMLTGDCEDRSLKVIDILIDAGYLK